MLGEQRSSRNYENFGLVDLEESYKLAIAKLDECRFDPKDFSSVYGPEKIERDEKTVREYEMKSFNEDSPESKRRKQFSTVFESVFNTHAELSEWLGSSTFITPTALYDDYENHVDMVAEFKEAAAGNSHLALGIDVTFSKTMTEKFERIKKEIGTGEMATIKYFRSDDGDFTGQLSNIPRVVIAVEPATITELVKLDAGKKNTELGNHWIQFQILEQLLVQMRVFIKYADKCGQDAVTRKLKINQAILQKILMERREKIGDKIIRDNSNEKFIQQLEAVF